MCLVFTVSLEQHHLFRLDSTSTLNKNNTKNESRKSVFHLRNMWHNALVQTQVEKCFNEKEKSMINESKLV